MNFFKQYRIFTLIVLNFCFGMTVSSLGAMKRGSDENDEPTKKIKINDEVAVLAPVIISSQSEVDLTLAETFSSQSSSSSAIVLGKRPNFVQAVCDEKFEEIKDVKPNKWGYDGSHGAYGILGLDDVLLLKDLVFKQDKKDIYIIDVGCACGNWGRLAMNVLLDDETCKQSGKHFHIFSITGGKECAERTIKKHNITHHLFNQFKIENIGEEFLSRGFELANNVDLIVSHRTLQHLVDPLGTLKLMYELLALDGLLLSNGFFFSIEGSEDVEKFPFDTNWNFLTNTNLAALFRVKDNFGQESGEFMLKKTSDQKLCFPLDYNKSVIPLSLDSEYQFSSRVLTVFKKGDIKQAECLILSEDKKDDSFGYYPCYCDNNNKSSKNLYEYLKRKKFFIWQSDTK